MEDKVVREKDTPVTLQQSEERRESKCIESTSDKSQAQKNESISLIQKMRNQKLQMI